MESRNEIFQTLRDDRHLLVLAGAGAERLQLFGEPLNVGGNQIYMPS